jgi:hypothetical protein
MDDNRHNMLAIGHMTLKVSWAKNMLRLATTQYHNIYMYIDNTTAASMNNHSFLTTIS